MARIKPQLNIAFLVPLPRMGGLKGETGVKSGAVAQL